MISANLWCIHISDDNGRVTYSLVSGVNISRPEFGVFPDGSLYVAQKLDRETKVCVIITHSTQNSLIISFFSYCYFKSMQI